MEKRPRSSSLFWTLLVVVALAVLWGIFGPVGLGGRSSYAIINGNSMEPLYHTGDLVILQPVTNVEVGKIIAYAYPGLGRVIHRVIGIEAGRYIFKGDHNDWLDGYRPSDSDLIGEAWIHIPRLGRWVLWLREPVNMALLMSIAGGFLMFRSFFSPLRKQIREAGRPPSGWSPADMDAATREVGLFALSLLLFVSIVLGLLAFTTPAYRTVSDDLPYVHTIAYTYTAPANPKVYDSPEIQPGEPLFHTLNCFLDVTLVYSLTSSAPFSLTGSYQTSLLVTEPNGWKRTYELLPQTAFEGGLFGGQTRLDVCKIRKDIDEMVKLTGLNRSVFDVSLKTEIRQTGEIGGRPYDETILASLDFGLDPVQFFLYRDPAGETDPLNWRKDGWIKGSRREVNRLSFLGLQVAVMPVRIFAITAFALAVIGIVWLGFPMLRRTSPKNQIEEMRLKYYPLIVRALQSPTGGSRKQAALVVALASMEDLVQVARQAGALIIETPSEGSCTYSVFLDSVTYTYTLEITG